MWAELWHSDLRLAKSEADSSSEVADFGIGWPSSVAFDIRLQTGRLIEVIPFLKRFCRGGMSVVKVRLWAFVLIKSKNSWVELKFTQFKSFLCACSGVWWVTSRVFSHLRRFLLRAEGECQSTAVSPAGDGLVNNQPPTHDLVGFVKVVTWVHRNLQQLFVLLATENVWRLKCLLTL